MRVILHVPTEGGSTKLPIPIGTDGHGRSCLVAPMIGALVRLDPQSGARVLEEKPKALLIEIDDLDPNLAGVWMREKDLGSVGL